jgi:hypothetical protein
MNIFLKLYVTTKQTFIIGVSELKSVVLEQIKSWKKVSPKHLEMVHYWSLEVQDFWGKYL